MLELLELMVLMVVVLDTSVFSRVVSLALTLFRLVVKAELSDSKVLTSVVRDAKPS